jgi:GNAT superfamily N-acetyltransferase
MKKLINSFYEAERSFFEALSQESVHIEGLADAYVTGIPTANFNLAVLRHKSIVCIEKFKALYARYQLPWALILPTQVLDQTLEDWLRQNHFMFQERSMALGLSLKDYIASDPKPTLQIRESFLEDWGLPLESAFESTRPFTHLYKHAHARALQNNARFHHFTLHKNGHPVSSLTLSFSGTHARLDDVATQKEYQRRGYAEHLIRHALAFAKTQGATDCFLEASSEGLSLYKKIGFQPLFENTVYCLA